MRPEPKSNRDGTQARRTYKTKDDFLRWLSEKDTRKQPVAQKESKQAYRAISLALMVWADDGGATS
jgi:hypothetical protein